MAAVYISRLHKSSEYVDQKNNCVSAGKEEPLSWS